MRIRRARVYLQRPAVWWTSADLTRARVDFAYFARRVIVHRAGRPNNTLGGLSPSTLAASRKRTAPPARPASPSPTCS